MRQVQIFAAILGAAAFSLCSVQGAMAEQVTVEGVHLCCGQCVKGVNKALAGVNGVSSVNVSKDEETVTFEAQGKSGVEAGLKALYAAGFYGKSSQPGPDLSIDEKAKKNEIEITGLHLCCPACVKTAEAALKGVSGVKGISSTAKQGKITLTGESISLADTLKALHESGFHGTVK